MHIQSTPVEAVNEVLTSNWLSTITTTSVIIFVGFSTIVIATRYAEWFRIRSARLSYNSNPFTTPPYTLSEIEASDTYNNQRRENLEPHDDEQHGFSTGGYNEVADGLRETVLRRAASSTGVIVGPVSASKIAKRRKSTTKSQLF